MRKNAQAALEFLMTYGWAILVVLIVIGALAYFGVFNPNNLVPEKCVLTTGLSCQDFKLESDQFSINLENGFGRSIAVQEVRVLKDGTNGCSSGLLTDTLENGKSLDVVLDLDEGVAGSCDFTDDGRKTKLTLEIDYYFADSTSTYSKTLEGDVLAKIQTA